MVGLLHDAAEGVGGAQTVAEGVQGVGVDGVGGPSERVMAGFGLRGLPIGI